jgi:hypothetical protein
MADFSTIETLTSLRPYGDSAQYVRMDYSRSTRAWNPPYNEVRKAVHHLIEAAFGGAHYEAPGPNRLASGRR